MTGSRPGHFVSRNDSGQVVHPQAGKVTVDLASHWPCIADSVAYPPTGSMAWVKEMSNPLWSTTLTSLPFYVMVN